MVDNHDFSGKRMSSLPCTNRIAVSLTTVNNSIPTKFQAIQYTSVLLYFVIAVAVRVLLIVVSFRSSVSCCMKPLLTTIWSDADVPFTKNTIRLASTATQLNSTSSPLTALTLLNTFNNSVK